MSRKSEADAWRAVYWGNEFIQYKGRSLGKKKTVSHVSVVNKFSLERLYMA